MDNTTKIGDFTYTVELLPPDISHDLFIDLFKMIGPSLVSSYASGDMMNQDLTKVATGFADRLDKELVAKARSLFKGVTKVQYPTGQSIALKDCYEIHFRGKMVDLNKWFLFCCKVQFADFLSLLATPTDQGSQQHKVAVE